MVVGRKIRKTVGGGSVVVVVKWLLGNWKMSVQEGSTRGVHKRGVRSTGTVMMCRKARKGVLCAATSTLYSTTRHMRHRCVGLVHLDEQVSLIRAWVCLELNT